MSSRSDEARAPAFSVGQRVRKIAGYGFEGPIASLNQHEDGTFDGTYTVRLQVGCIADGMKHIFSEAQLEEARADTARPAAVECKARKSVAEQDCDWPTCDCDPYAEKVIAALDESGALAHPDEQGLHAATIEASATWWEQNGGRFARQRADLMRRALLPQPKGGE